MSNSEDQSKDGLRALTPGMGDVLDAFLGSPEVTKTANAIHGWVVHWEACELCRRGAYCQAGQDLRKKFDNGGNDGKSND